MNRDRLKTEIEQNSPKMYLDIISKYQVKGQVAILLSLDLANIMLYESGMYLPFADYIPYNQDIDMLLEETARKSPDEKLKTLCELVLVDIDMVCATVDIQSDDLQNSFSYALTLLLIRGILQQMSKVSPDKYESLLDYELKGPHVYHFRELEKIAEKAMDAAQNEFMSSFESFVNQ